MLVLFLSFALVLSVSANQTLLAAGNKQVLLKDQLEKSITHVSEILVDIEHKIGRERQILAQMDNDLKVLRGPNEFEFDIFWGNATTVSETPGKFGNFSYTIKTTPSLFPPPSKVTLTTLPASWISTKPGQTSVVKNSPYIEHIIKNKDIKHYGYFSSFVDEFTELIFDKDIEISYPVTAFLSLMFRRGIREGTFRSLGDDLIEGLSTMLSWFDSLTPERVKQQAEVLHHVIQIKDKGVSTDVNNLINFYDKMFTKEQGHDVYEALEVFYIYPLENITLATVGEEIYRTVLAPYFVSEGTRQQRRLVQHLLMAAHDFDPNFRSQARAMRSWKDPNQAVLPFRRSMNYRKVVKHFLLKHPKLFKKIKRQYKHDKKNKNHHLSHTQKRHHNYRKSRGSYYRHGHIQEHEPITQREVDSSKSDSYYGENLDGETHQQENMHKVLFTQTRKKLRDKLRQRKLLKGKRTAPLSIMEQPGEEQVDPKFLKQLAIRFLRKRQQSQHFNRNRRLNIPSSEEDICNHSQYIEDSIENSKLHKIREVSSYSDEEDRLRTNLYDALRHGNRKFKTFRRSGDDIINKKAIQDLSSEPDDEWVLKNNIYKVFEQAK